MNLPYGIRVHILFSHKKQKSKLPFGSLLFGTAEGIRTPDLLVRSQTLYPAELQPHTAVSFTAWL